jgi:hypothetical protein
MHLSREDPLGFPQFIGTNQRGWHRPKKRHLRAAWAGYRTQLFNPEDLDNVKCFFVEGAELATVPRS